MKNKIKKGLCLIAVVTIVLASFILPASAAELSEVYPQYIDFLDYSGDFRKRVQWGSQNLDVILPTPGKKELTVSTNPVGGWNASYFFISNTIEMSLNHDWFGFIFEFEYNAMFDGGFIYRTADKESDLLAFINNEIHLFGATGKKIYTLPPSGMCQIACMVNVVTNEFYVSIDDTFGDGVDFVFYDMTSHLFSVSSVPNRFVSFYTTPNQSFAYPEMTIKKMVMYEIPFGVGDLSASQFFNLYTGIFDIDVGYSQGWSEGWSQGLASGYEDGHLNGYRTGKNEGYQNGKKDGYTEGKNEYYNELYEKGLEAIDENEGTMIQGFLAGMWNGVQNFVQELLDGITFSGLSLRSIVTTLFAVLFAAFIIRMVR